MANFCKNCGNPLKQNEQFCGKCGTKVDPAPKPPASSAPSGAPVRTPNPGAFNPADLLSDSILKIGVMVASAVLILATLFPYMSVLGESISLTIADGHVGDGIFFILLAILCIVSALIKKPIPELVAGIIALLLCFFEMSQVIKMCKQYESFTGLISKQSGYYLMIFASFALCALCVLHFLTAKKNKVS